MLLLLWNVAFTLASAAISSRLLLLWWRTRKLPELCIALTFLSGGVFAHTWGWVARFVAPGARFVGPLTEFSIWALLSRLFFVVGVLSVLVAAARIFRPRSHWASGVVGFILPFYAYHLCWEEIVGPLPPTEWLSHPMYWLGGLANLTPWAWMCLESLGFWRKLRKKRRLGLPSSLLLEFRMLMWVVGAGAISLLHFTFTLSVPLLLVYGLRAPQHTTGVLGVVSAVAFWLAFYPPKRLVNRARDAGGEGVG